MKGVCSFWAKPFSLNRLTKDEEVLLRCAFPFNGNESVSLNFPKIRS